MDAPRKGRAVIGADAQAVARAAASWFVERMQQSEGPFRVALSGGSTPKTFYRLISGPDFREWIAWDRLQIFWGDERFVSHDSPDSNYRMAEQNLLSRVPLRNSDIHPMPTDGAPDDAARKYEATLKGIYGAATLHPSRPLFDVNLLGIGADGHTASLLPDAPELDERTRWVVPVIKGRPEARLTLTYPALESSRFTVFLATGADKAAAVRGARAGDTSLPAGRLTPQGELIWFLDRAAAADTA